MPKREYGPDGIKLSVIGLGGVLLMDEPQDYADRMVAEAFERGVNYFDVAPTYNNAQERMGPALEPYRERVFLACKTMQRTAEGARAELNRALEQLRTDHFDLYQLHAIHDVEKDVNVAFAKGGAMEVLLEAKRAGRVRYLGFSAHSEQAALLALDRYDFDSVLFPVNFTSWIGGGFGPAIMQRAQEKGASRLALKAMALQSWSEDHPQREQYPKAWYEPITDQEIAELALRWTLAQPVTATVPPGTETMFRWALDIAENLSPLSADEEQRLNELAGSLNPTFPLPA